MWKRINGFLETLSSHLALATALGGGALMSIILGWAAHATKKLTPYAPFSWVLAALVGALLFAALVWLVCKGKDVWIRASIIRTYHGVKERVNPAQDLFKNQRIYMNDLVIPFHRLLRGKTFIECEIVGPANIIFSTAGRTPVGMTSCEFVGSAAVSGRNDVIVPFSIMLEDCNFLRCKLVGVILFSGEGDRGNGAFSSMPDSFWITPKELSS